MPLQQSAQWVDPPGMRTTFQEGRAGFLQLDAHKEFSPDHTLHLGVFKTTFYEGCSVSSKLIPLVVGLWEKKGDERLKDFYSFDNNGVCLSHGYSRWEGGKTVVNEQHDTDISRLVEHGRVIGEMIGDYPIPVPLVIHTTVIDLRNNCLR